MEHTTHTNTFLGAGRIPAMQAEGKRVFVYAPDTGLGLLSGDQPASVWAQVISIMEQRDWFFEDEERPSYMDQDGTFLEDHQEYVNNKRLVYPKGYRESAWKLSIRRIGSYVVEDYFIFTEIGWSACGGGPFLYTSEDFTDIDIVSGNGNTRVYFKRDNAPANLVFLYSNGETETLVDGEGESDNPDHYSASFTHGYLGYSRQDM